MTNSIDYFPEGIALGEAFLNREHERATLIQRIRANKHSALMAPRRYGKTSLVMKVAEEMKISHCCLDLLAAYDAAYVRDQIVHKVGKLVVELLPKFHKAKETVIHIFKHMKPEIALGAFGQRLTVHLSNNPLQDITDLLLKLDETAKHFKKKAVIFIDEFQQISQLPNHHSIEAAIRHAVERSQHISYVFSGSNRQLLEQMLGDQGRPLYRLCQTIHIGRIEKSAYVENLESRSQERWKKGMSEEVMERIFLYTELHPFYMNVLCQSLWDQAHSPSVAEVDTTWHNYVKIQRNIISHDITSLSVNQRKLLIALGKKPTSTVQSSEFMTPLNLSLSSVRQALNVLLSKDMIYQDEQRLYRALDPAMKYYLTSILWEDGVST